MTHLLWSHLALPILTLVLWVVVRQQIFVLPRLRKELIELNKRRADRVQTALAVSPAAAWTEPAIAPNHAFGAWVTLNPDGTLSIGGEILRPSKRFHVVARDVHHVSRAVAIATGTGDVLIHYLGQVFVGRFEHGSWNVQSVNSLQ